MTEDVEHRFASYSKIVHRSAHKSEASQKPAQNGDVKDPGDEKAETQPGDRGIYDLDDGLYSLNDDKDWDTDLENEEIKDTYDHTGRTTYIDSCKCNKVVPASFFLRHMNDTKLRMKHHGLGPSGIIPVCVALVSNTNVLHLNLTDNWLGAEGGSYVCEMLKENCYLLSANLSDNRLGCEFTAHLPAVFKTNVTLTRLVLSGNELDDRAAPGLAEAITIMHHLETLVLSHNSFGVKAGIVLGPAIADNVTLKHLDISWNNIRRKGAVEFAKGVKNNGSLQRLNLAWNGFGLDGAKSLADALKNNSVLEHIDLSNNRITAEGAVIIGKALSVNETLVSLMLGQNPMQSAGCYAICAALLKNENCQLKIVDFSDILVNADYRDVSQLVTEKIPGIELKTGGEDVPTKPKIKLHPMIKLRNFITKHNLRLQDVFATWDKDNSMSVTHEEFTQGILELGLRLSKDEIQEVVSELDQDGDGEINYCELVIGHADFGRKEQTMNEVISTMRTMAQN